MVLDSPHTPPRPILALEGNKIAHTHPRHRFHLFGTHVPRPMLTLWWVGTALENIVEVKMGKHADKRIRRGRKSHGYWNRVLSGGRRGLL